ncbi:MAG: VCBS repeat-containing protein [Acidobacteriaceae bacterium]
MRRQWQVGLGLLSVMVVAQSGSGAQAVPASTRALDGISGPAQGTVSGAPAGVSAASLAVGSNLVPGASRTDSDNSSTEEIATGAAPGTVSQAIGTCTTANPNPNPNPESFAAVGDFNGDCKSDVLWRNSSTRQVEIWLMNGTTFSSSGSPGSPTSDWVIQGAGDFNGDGKADILWRNSTSGEVYIWLMNGTAMTSSGSLGSVSSDWSIAGVGDFNGDGKADILWWNSTTGQVYLWFMNGTTMSGGGSVTYVSSGWNIAGIGDFNGDGKADILWRNSSTGQVYVWLMNGTTIAGTGSPGTPTMDWSIAGVGDFDGNGKSDILWRNASGQVYLWFMNGTATASSGSLGYVSSAWSIQGVGDYDGSGRAAILWRNGSTEQVYVWLVNGTTVGSSGSPGTPAAAWQIAPVTVQTTVATRGVDVTTYHFDIGRTGLNPNETTLTSSNVTSSKFGLLRLLGVDGVVDAQPLYLSNLTAGGQQRNVVFAVTEHDSVYAFDADTGAQIWKTSVLGANETTSGDHGCSQITPEIGITSTPVIDRTAGPNGTIFVVGMSLDKSGVYHQRLHALDVTTGAELANSPTEIQAKYPGTGENSSGGNVVFDPGQYAERVGLLLMNGTIYMGWTSHCDIDPYTGWLMAYSESTLAQTSVLNLTPNGSEGSIWMAGTGLAADSSGNIYFLDANGTFDSTLNASGFPTSNDFGNAFLKISTTGGKLAVADYFETYNGISESSQDEDLGSGGALVLPDITDSSGTVHHLAVGAGKDQNIYVVNRDSMGKYNSQNNSAAYQAIVGAIGGVWSMPAYFDNTVYYGAVSDNLKAFPITNAKLATTASVKSANTFAYPGMTPAVSANGTTNGIVWGVENSSPAVLHAFDATTLQELYNSNQAANNRDQFGNGNKFITPMVVNGKVFVGTPNAVAVFGLLL